VVPDGRSAAMLRRCVQTALFMSRCCCLSVLVAAACRFPAFAVGDSIRSLAEALSQAEAQSFAKAQCFIETRCFADDETPRAQNAQPPIVALTTVPGSTGRDDDDVVFASQSGLTPSFLKSGIANPHDVVFSPDGTVLAVCGGEPGTGGLLELFMWPADRQSPSPRRDLQIGDDSLYSVAWSPDGSRLAVAGLDGAGRVLDASTGRERLRLNGHSRGLTGIAFLSSQRLVTSSLDGSVRVWDAESGDLLRTLANHTGPVTGLCLGPEREPARLRMAASFGDDRTVRVWQPEIGRLVRFVRLSSKPLAAAWLSRSSIAVSHGGLLAVACLDGRVRLVAVDTVAVLAEKPVLDGPAYCIAVSESDWTLVVAGHRGMVKRMSLGELLPDGGSAN